jgi:hypothetical protein
MNDAVFTSTCLRLGLHGAGIDARAGRDRMSGGAADA